MMPSKGTEMETTQEMGWIASLAGRQLEVKVTGVEVARRGWAGCSGRERRAWVAAGRERAAGALGRHSEAEQCGAERSSARPRSGCSRGPVSAGGRLADAQSRC